MTNLDLVDLLNHQAVGVRLVTGATVARAAAQLHRPRNQPAMSRRSVGERYALPLQLPELQVPLLRAELQWSMVQ